MSQKKSVKKRPEMNELALIRRARLEDISAYEELVGRYYERIYGLVYGMTCNRTDAEVVAQEVFVKAWKAIGHFRDHASFYTWLYRIGVNRSVNFQKKKRHSRTVECESYDPDVEQSDLYKKLLANGSISDASNLSEFQKEINEALFMLSDKQRASVVMHNVQLMSNDDIAGIMGCSEEVIQAQLESAHEKIEQELSSYLSALEGVTLDGSNLLALKIFERPDQTGLQEQLDATMIAVHAAHKRPSLLLFPDKSMGWMLAQPRYGIVAIFLLFLVLNMCGRPVPTGSSDSLGIDHDLAGLESISLANTNGTESITIPIIHPDYSLGGSLDPTGFPQRLMMSPAGEPNGNH